ncbi:MAG: two-component regulator propeller domain-containing protein [Bacteroidota bacterium]
MMSIFYARSLFVLLLMVVGAACEEVGQKPGSGEASVGQEELQALPGMEVLELDSSLQIAEFVVEVYGDKKGHLWFGTMAKGVARYDGEKLTYLDKSQGLGGNTICSITEDQDGNYWFGGHAGATHWDGTNFTHFGPEQGLPGVGCQILVDREGNVWAGTNAGAFRFDGQAFQPFSLPTPRLDTEDYKWERGKVWCLMQDKSGNIWFGRDGYGALRFNPDSLTYRHITTKDGLISNNVSQIVEDERGHIWFGSLTSDFPEYQKVGGLTRYDGENFTTFPEVKGLTENDIYTLYVDGRGDVWIGAIGIGAYRYDGETFHLYNQTDRPDLNQVFGIQGIWEDERGRMWFGFSGGLFRFNGTAFVNVNQYGPWD